MSEPQAMPLTLLHTQIKNATRGMKGGKGSKGGGKKRL